MTSKPTDQLTLKDKLSRLTFLQACKLLGENGKQLLRDGGQYEIDIYQQVYLKGDLFQVKFPYDNQGNTANASFTLMADAKSRLKYNCTRCNGPCEHVAAALSLVLEEKMLLGLAKPPVERIPIESLGEEELVAQAIEDRRERAKKEKFRLESIGAGKSKKAKRAWGEYTLTSAASGKTYHLSVLGTEPGDCWCSCPDFRKNTLGTCKHLIYAIDRIKSRFPASKRKPHRAREFSLRLHYADGVSLRLYPPHKPDPAAVKLVDTVLGKDVTDVPKLIRSIAKLEQADQPVKIYPDADEFIDQQLFRNRIQGLVKEIRDNPAQHPLRKSLLKTELLPYQMDGIAFAVGAGRAILADDMGLGKTIQGIGVAEMLAQQADIKKVLVICPTSLKSQWRNEIHKFCDRDCQLILGGAAERSEQYDNEAFFTICNYEQVLRDLIPIEQVNWDLIILDEAQRIKNWEAKTTATVKSLKSKYALVLTGTPLENRLGELFSVVEFVDDRRLGPGFRFFNQHRIVDEKGKVLGYKNMAKLRKTLAPILLRRTRADVLKELPPRTTEIVRIPPTDEQLEINNNNMRIVAQICSKPYITEMDMLRLQRSLLAARMSADSTFLNTKEEPSYSSKLERLDELIGQLFEEPDRKVVLFSEWTTMLSLIEKILVRRKLNYVRLDGSVPQKKRQALVNEFQTNPQCQLFLTSNAGSTGLNLQAANTVINVDLPWNPAVLEQRIARAHRMGQTDPVHVYLLVTESTLEESLLVTLEDKSNLALAALDCDSEVDTLNMVSGYEEMRRRLEILLGAKPDAAVDESQKESEVKSAVALSERQQRVASAGGEMLGAVFSFLGELLDDSPEAKSMQPAEEVVNRLRESLTGCATEDADGRQQLTVTLPNRDSLNQLANTLARLMVSADGG